jgi:sialate O-acetylesterase
MNAYRKGSKVEVPFRDVSGSLTAYNGAPNAFELCDAKSCHWARASLAGDRVLLTAPGTTTRVRYCWGDSPICTLSDASALPAGPFELAIDAK